MQRTHCFVDAFFFRQTGADFNLKEIPFSYKGNQE